LSPVVVATRIHTPAATIPEREADDPISASSGCRSCPRLQRACRPSSPRAWASRTLCVGSPRVACP